MNTSPLCRSSNLWSFDSKKKHSHIGALVLRQLRVAHKKRFNLLQFIFLGMLALVAGFAAHQFIKTPYTFTSIKLLVTTVILLLALPSLFFSGLSHRNNFLENLFHADTWMGICLAGYLGMLWFYEGSPLQWLALAALYFFWLALRIWEAHRLGSHIYFENKAFFWRALENMNTHAPKLKRVELLITLTGLALIFGRSIFQILFDSGWDVMLRALPAVLPLSIPIYRWSMTSTFSRAAREGALFDRLSDLEKFRKSKTIRCHQQGVFTEPRLELSEEWYDATSTWKPQEIHSLVKSLTQFSKHPISVALSEKMKAAKGNKFDLSDIGFYDHLGLQTHFRDAQGVQNRLFLGNFQWVKLERHDFNPEGKRLVDLWTQDGLCVSILSCNSRVIAAFAFKSHLKMEAEEAIARLKEEDFQFCLISSNYRNNLQVNAHHFEEVSMELLPIERELQLQHWGERVDEQLVFQSDWDPKPKSVSTRSFVFTRDPTQALPPGGALLVNGGLQGAKWLLLEAPFWQRTVWVKLSIALIVVGISILLNSFWLASLLSLSCYVFFILRGFNSRLY